MTAAEDREPDGARLLQDTSAAENRGRWRFIRLLVVVIVLIALFLFARSIEWREVGRALRGTSPGLLVAAALVNLISVALKGVRWWIFLRPIGVTSLWLAVRGTFVGAGLNNILIANGGEAARVVFVSREAKADATQVIATLALERLFEFLGYFVTLALAMLVLTLPPELARLRLVAALALVAMAVFLAYLLRQPRVAAAAPAAAGGWLGRIRSFGRNFMHTLRGVASLSRFAGALAVSMGVWALQVATYHLTAMAAGLPITVAGTVVALLAVNIGFAVRATPGNVGVFQMVYAVTAAGLGLNKDLATGTAFLIQIQQILPVTLLGLAFAPTLLFRGKDNARDV